MSKGIDCGPSSFGLALSAIKNMGSGRDPGVWSAWWFQINHELNVLTTTTLWKFRSRATIRISLLH
jgi:hypothetical protein